MQAHADWLVPDWPAPSNVRALCTTRAGGHSAAPFDTLNLGAHVGDDAGAVAANRQVLRSALGGAVPVFVDQVHGVRTVALDAGSRDGIQADGCVTTHALRACTIMVADCLPVLFTDAGGTAVAAAHAGWRGLAGGVLESCWEGFAAAARIPSGSSAIKTIAWLGPCIGPDAFEVGQEVKDAFDAGGQDASALFKPRGNGKYLADLQGLARLRLQAMGIHGVYGNDGSSAWCTVANPSRFFSHRRDRVSGRFAAAVWLG